MSSPHPRRAATARLLEEYRPPGPPERRHLEQMQQLLSGEGDPFARDHFQPGHFTASAIVLDPDREAIVLVHHATLNRWLQPGGHFEAGDEGPIAAARREVYEETGLSDLELVDPRSGLFDVDVHSIPARGAEPQHLHHDLRLLFVARNRELRPGHEVRAARWVELAEVERLETDRSVLRCVGKIAAG
jgi:8-oxo-dGTP pyrophosphatase MutT (NUDIX family)